MSDPVRALTAERFGVSPWWKSRETLALEDNDLLCGIRRVALSEAVDDHDEEEP